MTSKSFSLKSNSILTRQTLTCILAVFTLSLLLCGDLIVSRFLQVHPNENYAKESKEEARDEYTFSLPVYDVSFMESISLSSLISKISSGETIFVFSGRSTCSPCQRFVSILREVVLENSIFPLYYLDRNSIKEDTDGYEEFLKFSKSLEEKFDLTPYFMVFQHGTYQAEMVGMYEGVKKGLEEMFQKYVG